jgi:hypothetical protein
MSELRSLASSPAAAWAAMVPFWVDSFSPTPQTGYLVGMPPESTDD